MDTKSVSTLDDRRQATGDRQSLPRASSLPSAVAVLADARRIAVIGSPGAGKSTLARRMGDLLGLPVYHLDALYWRAGWVETPQDEWRPIVEELAARERWIIDGNYGGTQEVRLAAADAVIYLEYPTWLCLWRALRRVGSTYGRVRSDMAQGCPEKFDWEFFAYIWSFRRSHRAVIRARLERWCESKPVYTFRRPREASRLLARLGSQQ